MKIQNKINKDMETKRIRVDRLRILADHLLNGKLGHKVFDFSTYNEGENSENECGTNGCAIGECPIAFPDDWMWAKRLPVLKRIVESQTGDFYFRNYESGMEFFNISHSQYNHLFMPEAQEAKYGGKSLCDYSTKEEVAKNILTFCDLVDNGTIK